MQSCRAGAKLRRVCSLPAALPRLDTHEVRSGSRTEQLDPVLVVIAPEELFNGSNLREGYPGSDVNNQDDDIAPEDSISQRHVEPIEIDAAMLWNEDIDDDVSESLPSLSRIGASIDTAPPSHSIEQVNKEWHCQGWDAEQSHSTDVSSIPKHNIIYEIQVIATNRSTGLSKQSVNQQDFDATAQSDVFGSVYVNASCAETDAQDLVQHLRQHSAFGSEHCVCIPLSSTSVDEKLYQATVLMTSDSTITVKVSKRISVTSGNASSDVSDTRSMTSWI